MGQGEDQQQIQPTNATEPESNPGFSDDGKRALSPLRHSCSQEKNFAILYARYVNKYVQFISLWFVFQFDLVCSRGYLGWLANGMLFGGWAVGAIVLGVVADKYGRKSVLFPSLLIVLVVTFATAFAKAFWIVAVCRFIVGFFEAGCFLSMFVMATELVGPEKRALAGTLVWFYFTAGLMILGLMAYFVRNWRTLLILSSAPWIFVLAFWK